VSALAVELGLPIHVVVVGESPPAMPLHNLLGTLSGVAGSDLVSLSEPSERQLREALASVSGLITCSFRLVYRRRVPPVPEVCVDQVKSVADGVQVRASSRGGVVDSLALVVDGWPACDTDGPTLTHTVPAAALTPGPHELAVAGHGRNGERTLQTRRITVDRATCASFLSPDPGSLIATPLYAVLSVWARPPTSFEASIDGQPVGMEPVKPDRSLPAGETRYRLLFAPGYVGEGVHAVRVRVRDGAGQRAEASTWFKADIPSVRVSVPSLLGKNPLSGRRDVERRTSIYERPKQHG
jgi:hypothetical protein